MVARQGLDDDRILKMKDAVERAVWRAVESDDPESWDDLHLIADLLARAAGMRAKDARKAARK